MVFFYLRKLAYFAGLAVWGYILRLLGILYRWLKSTFENQRMIFLECIINLENHLQKYFDFRN